MGAVALVLRSSLADSRRVISAEDPDKRFNTISAVGFLLMLLRGSRRSAPW